jgi:transposase
MRRSLIYVSAMVKKLKRPIRVKEPERRQVELRAEAIDDVIGADHPARLIDRVVGTLDLDAFTAKAKSVEFGAGRPVMSPRMMLTLWLYAISQGVGSAREIERLTTSDNAFRWIVGNLRPSHDVIAKFRVDHGAAFDQMLTDVLAVLDHKDLLPMGTMAQDGTRVRASASAPSFRSDGGLKECREHAALHLKAVLADADNPEISAAAHAAREAGARDYQRRVEDAIATLQELPPKKDGGEVRASTTDKDARVMKMADGGFRPAYNIELGVVGKKMGGPRAIVGVRVTNLGTDIGSVLPMQDDVIRRVGRAPAVVIADSNHFKIDDVNELERRGILPVIPPPRSRGGNGSTARKSTSAMRIGELG